jgi:hypothetical protein
LRQRLQFRDEQVHSLGHAYENLQHQCQLQVRSGEEELQRREEHNQRLSASLRRAGADIEELQRQLKEREKEGARLADSLQACREREWQQIASASDAVPARGGQVTSARSLGSALRQPPSPKPPSPNRDTFVDLFALASNEQGVLSSSQGGSSASRGSPRQPTPHSPNAGSPRPLSTAQNPGNAQALGPLGMQEQDRWAEVVAPALEAGSQSPQIGLQERREGVAQLEEEIHKQIAQHRNTIGGQMRCPWPVGSPTGGAPASVRSTSPGSNQMRSTSPGNLRSTSPGSNQKRMLEESCGTSPEKLAHVNGGLSLSPEHGNMTASEHVLPTTPLRSPQAMAASPASSSSPAALPLAAASRTQPGRAATASRVERPTKVPSKSGGSLVAVNIFEEEDPSQRRARQQAATQTQQRVAKQIEQRRKQVREKARPDDLPRPRSGTEAGMISPCRNGQPQAGSVQTAAQSPQAHSTYCRMNSVCFHPTVFTISLNFLMPVFAEKLQRYLELHKCP